MKNVKSIFAMLVLVTVMGVSSTFGSGIYLGDRSINNQGEPTCSSTDTALTAILDNTGIIIAGLTGIIIAGKGDVQEQPCTATAKDGIIIAG
jgi:hypothetical protein